MKNCPNCKIQYDDSVNFCNNCGSALVVEETPVAPVATENKPNILFTFLGNVLAILSAMFGVCGIASASIDVNVYYSKYTASINAYGTFEVAPACAVFALLLALGAIAFGVINSIQVLVKKQGKEAMFNGITRLVIGTALLIFSIVLLANLG